MPAGELTRKAEVRRRMLEAGAHWCGGRHYGTPAIIETINQKNESIICKQEYETFYLC